MSQRDLAKKLKAKFETANMPRLRTGVIVSVSGSLAVVTIGGNNVSGVPIYASVTGLTAGSKVDVLMDGGSPRIIGKLA